jgi:hypothetical protein
MEAAAIAAGVGQLFGFLNTALQPGLMATSAYFQQLLQARPTLQNPLAGVYDQRSQNNQILLIGGMVIIAILVIVIAMRTKKS